MNTPTPPTIISFKAVRLTSNCVGVLSHFAQTLVCLFGFLLLAPAVFAQTARPHLTVGDTRNTANAAPVLDLNGGASGIDYAASYIPTSSPVSIVDSDELTVSDDDNLFVSATIILTNNLNGSAETLAVNTSGTSIMVSLSATSTTRTLTLSGLASRAEYVKVLRTTLYGNTASPANTTQRIVEFRLNDGNRQSAVARTRISLENPQSGPNFIVTNTEDSDGACGISHCSLRQAILAANNHSSANIITFAGSVSGTITLLQSLGTLTITGPTTISGPGARVLAVSGGTLIRVFTVTGGPSTITGLTVKEGRSAGRSLSPTGEGGGILNQATLTIRDCALKDNLAQGGSGLFSGSNGGVGQGGGIANRGTLTLSGCTFQNNSAIGGGGRATLESGSSGGDGGAGRGGAVFNASGASLTILNCTFSGNTARGGSGASGNVGGTGGDGSGSGLYNQGTTVVNSATVNNNTSQGGAGGTGSSADGAAGLGRGALASEAGSGEGSTTVRNTISAGNLSSSSGPNVLGTFTSQGFNLIGTSIGSTSFNAATDQVGVSNPLLGALQNQGGPTDTIPLLFGSPAIDKGNGFGLTTDQRLQARPQDDPSLPNASGGNGSDIGAVERLVSRLSINDVTIVEGNSGTKTAILTVTLSASNIQTVTVNYATANGIAKAPGDYTTTSGSLSFAPGQTTKTLSVPVVGDALDEASEVFYVLLSNPVNTSTSRGRGVITITDDDATPSITIQNVSIGEGNSGQRVAAFRLNLSAPSGQAVRVNFATAVGTATAGNDYVSVASTPVAFNLGSSVAYARVYINGDLLNEPDETFFVNLSAPVNATIADSQALGTILNDDSAPALTINDVSISEGNSSTKLLTFTVSLSKASGQTVTVNYATADGIARSTSDYVAKSGMLSFAPGTALTRNISVTINSDTLSEGNETLYVLLTGAVNASVGRGRGTGTITNDDGSG